MDVLLYIDFPLEQNKWGTAALAQNIRRNSKCKKQFSFKSIMKRAASVGTSQPRAT